MWGSIAAIGAGIAVLGAGLGIGRSRKNSNSDDHCSSTYRRCCAFRSSSWSTRSEAVILYPVNAVGGDRIFFENELNKI